MASGPLVQVSCYQGSRIMLSTKHEKSIAIAPPFLEKLGASVIEYVVDTDTLGTFSGEVEREGSALTCARRKCEWSLNQLGASVEYAIASEGSFGPHPWMPFLPCDHEILYFIDQVRGFHLHLSHISEKTNYRSQVLSSPDELDHFALSVGFPSHALMVRPHPWERSLPIFKGLISPHALEDAFRECLKCSEHRAVCVETDMRAHLNPSRMRVIGELASMFCARLSALCPRCASPGWGRTRDEKGLRCMDCGSETEWVQSEIFSCVLCDYEERRGRGDAKKAADPEHCAYCNP